MRHIDIRKKRPSRWPWIAGALVLALILWGVTSLLRSEPEPEPEVATPTVQDTHPPAALPEPPYESYAADTGPGLADVAPLGEEDVGQTLRLEGEVVATGNETFWILAGGNVLRVDSDRHARKGDTLQVAGTLRNADPEKTERIGSVLDRHPASGGWTVVHSVKLVEERPDAGESADAGRRSGEG